MGTLLESIQERLEKFEIEAPETMLMLRQQIERFKSSKYGLTEIRDIMFEEDALEQCKEVDRDSLMWQEIRDLQYDISTQYCDCIYT